MVDNPHIKTTGAAGDFPPNLPQADDAQRSAVHILPQPVGGMKGQPPVAGAQPELAFGSAPRRPQQQRKGQVGGGFGQHVGGVAYRNAAPGGLGYIHIVQAHRQLADGAQAGRRVKQGGVHPVHNSGQDAIGGGGTAAHFVHRWRPFVGPQVNIGNLLHDGQRLGQQRSGDESLGMGHNCSPPGLTNVGMGIVGAL